MQSTKIFLGVLGHLLDFVFFLINLYSLAAFNAIKENLILDVFKSRLEKKCDFPHLTDKFHINHHCSDVL